MKMKKRVGFILLSLILAVCVVMSGCDNKNLKGMEIIIGNFWADYDTDTFEPQNAADERTLEWRIKIQEENGFKMRESFIASWGDFNSGFAATSIMTGKPAAQIFVLQGNWAMALISQNLAYPISNNKVIDFRNLTPVEEGQRPPDFNPMTYESFTFGDKSYGFSTGINLTNTQVIFFNKRLFREAGLDPDLPYDMQRDGTWTWDNFLDVCKRLTRDTNNDGIMDTYALPRDLSSEFLNSFIASNGAQYIGRGEGGRLVNKSNTPEFLEALQYLIRLNNEGVLKPRPEGTNWDWFKSEFADGNVAMRIDDSYVWNELGNMRDDWGVVLIPKGPRESDYRVYTRENIMIIPSVYKPAEVDRILYAAALWYTPQNDEDDWKTGQYHIFRDSRAVDETLALIRDTSRHIPKNFLFVPGFNNGDIAWQMWHHDGEASQLIEAVEAHWDSLIETVNEGLFSN